MQITIFIAFTKLPARVYELLPPKHTAPLPNHLIQSSTTPRLWDDNQKATRCDGWHTPPKSHNPSSAAISVTIEISTLNSGQLTRLTATHIVHPCPRKVLYKLNCGRCQRRGKDKLQVALRKTCPIFSNWRNRPEEQQNQVAVLESKPLLSLVVHNLGAGGRPAEMTRQKLKL